MTCLDFNLTAIKTNPEISTGMLPLGYEMSGFCGFEEFTKGYPGYVYADASKVHWVKSMGFLHLLHTWVLSNSSEKISISSLQLGHLHLNDCKFLNC
jgi:hypothetical protein